MIKINFRQQVLPHLIAVIVFYLITLAFFNPVFFKGMEISQHDILMHEGSANASNDYRELTDEEPLWTNSMFSGMPTYLVGARYSGDLIKYVHNIISLGLPHPVRLIFIAFVSFYILLLSFKVRPMISMAGAIGWGLNTYMLISIMAGHNAKVGAVAYIPLVIAGIHLAFTDKRWLGFALTALALALHLRVNHLQMTYYLLIIVLIYGLIEMIIHFREKNSGSFFKTVGLLTIAAILAVTANMGRILTTYEYGQYSIRGERELASESESSSGLDKDYAFEFSNSILEPLFLVIPNVYGGSSFNVLAENPKNETAKFIRRLPDPKAKQQYTQFTRAYWGKQRLSAPYYAGAISFLVMIVGLFFVDKKYKIWLISIIALSIILSWGSNFASFNYMIFDYLPGYNKFRSVTFVIIIAIYGINLLGFIGLEKFFSSADSKEHSIKFLKAAGIALGFVLLVILLAGMASFEGPYDSQLPAQFFEALKADRLSLLRTDGFRSFFLMLAAVAVIWFTYKKKLSVTFGFSLLILLVGIDMFSASKRYFPDTSYQKNVSRSYFKKTPADEMILQDTDEHYRVANLLGTFSEAKTSYHHSSVGGYHGAKIGRYQDLVERGISGEINGMIAKLQQGSLNFDEHQILNMLNTKYFKFGDDQRAVIENTKAYGNAWFAEEVRTAGSAEEEMNMTLSADLSRVAVLHQKDMDSDLKAISDAGSITLTDYSPNEITYRSTGGTSGNRIAVFSEVYYPEGWKAYINDNEVPILRANYVLRALKVPSGEHTITFRFEPGSYTTGNTLMFIGSLLIIICFVGVVVINLKRKEELQQEAKA
ncbi:MAG: YfhO family protein [Cyclobacteriaceae bacterium]